MKRLIMCFLIFIPIQGCAVFQDEPPKMEISQSSITVLINPNLDTAGRSWKYDDTCIIQLSEYPGCLGHEVMHCLSGQWHGTEDNDDYCY